MQEKINQNIVKAGENFLENYAKVILYTYPLLKTIEKDYADHIRNKALLSYNGVWDTERLTEYLAGEILRKERLEWLRSVVEEALSELSDLERDLIAIRYFGKRNRLRRVVALAEDKKSNDERTMDKKAIAKKAVDVEKTANDCGVSEKKLSKREYFRRQQRLAEKLSGMFWKKGLTKEVYLQDFAGAEVFERARRFVEEGKERNISLERNLFA